MASSNNDSEAIFGLKIPANKQTEITNENRRFELPTWFKVELKQIWTLSWSMTIISMFSLLMFPMGIVMCGHLGTPALAGVALATTVIHVSGTSVAIGLCTACDTVFSQSYGSSKGSMIKVHLLRSITIIMLFAFPYLAIHLNTESILLALDQDPVVARIAGNYLLYFMPALPALFLTGILIQYLRCQNILWPPVLASIIGFLGNTILQYIFVFILNFGTNGSALGLTMSTYVMALTLVAYVLLTDKQCDFTRETFQEWGPFVQLAIGGLLMTSLEWWAYQIGVLISGTIGETEIAATSILFNILSVAFLLPLGIGLACNIRVGQLLGAQDIEQAKRAVKIGIYLSLFASLIINSILLLLKSYVPLIFTFDSKIDDMVERIIPILAALNIFDAVSGACVGVLRGCGRQVLGSFVMFVGFFLVGLPIGVLLLLNTNLKVMGLYIGILVGVMSHCLIFAIIIRRTDWPAQVEEAQRRTAIVIDDIFTLPRIANGDESDEMRSLLSDKAAQDNRQEDFFTKLRRRFDASHRRQVIMHTTPELILRRTTFIAFMVLLFIIGLIIRFLILKPGSKDICPTDITSDEFISLRKEMKDKFSQHCYDFYVKEFL